MQLRPSGTKGRWRSASGLRGILRTRGRDLGADGPDSRAGGLGLVRELRGRRGGVEAVLWRRAIAPHRQGRPRNARAAGAERPPKGRLKSRRAAWSTSSSPPSSCNSPTLERADRSARTPPSPGCGRCGLASTDAPGGAAQGLTPAELTQLLKVAPADNAIRPASRGVPRLAGAGGEARDFRSDGQADTACKGVRPMRPFCDPERRKASRATLED